LSYLAIVRILFGETDRVEESGRFRHRVAVESDREVGPAEGGEELEAGGDERPDSWRVDERVCHEPPGQQALAACGSFIVERAEHRNTEQRYTVEAVEAHSALMVPNCDLRL
jgi:hypothetical protein